MVTACTGFLGELLLDPLPDEKGRSAVMAASPEDGAPILSQPDAATTLPAPIQGTAKAPQQVRAQGAHEEEPIDELVEPHLKALQDPLHEPKILHHQLVSGPREQILQQTPSASSAWFGWSTGSFLGEEEEDPIRLRLQRRTGGWYQLQIWIQEHDVDPAHLKSFATDLQNQLHEEGNSSSSAGEDPPIQEFLIALKNRLRTTGRLELFLRLSPQQAKKALEYLLVRYSQRRAHLEG